MRTVAVVLAGGLVVVALAVGLVLAEHPLTVIASNSVAANQELDYSGRGIVRGCQAQERVPAATRAVRISFEAFTGPSIAVSIRAGGRLATSGQRASAWGGGTVTVPVKPLSHALASAKLCYTTGLVSERLAVYGSPTGPSSAARSGRGIPLAGRFRVEYLGASRSSWLALASSVATHMGLGRAWPGTWVAVWVLVLMLATMAMAGGLLLRECHE